MYVDTHCHIHDSEFGSKSELSKEEILSRSIEAGVEKLICVGTSVKSSKEARDFAQNNDNCYFSIALHPHETEQYTLEELEIQINQIEQLVQGNVKKLVAVGECGLDYFYHSEPEIFRRQQKLLELHLELAQKLDLPLIFHIRDPKDRKDGELGSAFADFFRIVDKFDGVKGVIHSFSATTTELEGVLKRGFYIGLNGIMTFTTDEKQLEAARYVPSERLLIETDSPFLTPRPLRGTINEPKHVILITQFLSELRGESQAFLAKQTTKNAKQLFNL